MSINAICPKCRTSYQLADQQAGKKVRCKNCEAVFVAGESPSRPTAARGNSGPATQIRARPSSAATRSGGSAREDEEEQSRPQKGKKKGSKTIWIVGGLVGMGFLVLLCGGVITAAYFLFDGKSSNVASNNIQPLAPLAPFEGDERNPVDPGPIKAAPQVDEPIEGKPVEQAPPAAKNEAPPKNDPPPKKDTPPKKDPPPAQAKAPDPAPTPAKVEEASSKPAAANNDRLSAEAHDKAKRATVYLRVKMADGTQASGSGFFGCKEARNIVLTNAHVVGMLSPDSLRPQSIEVVVNSGEADEWTISARVLGVDRATDLAVLDIGEAPKNTPEPLEVKSAEKLHVLDTIYIFGFPFGEQLGKAITVADTKVTSLRNNKNGVLERVQVGAGMNPGNSGGPLVDGSGAVVGVAVAGIPGRAINFAIPAERVHHILNGRLSELDFQQPYYGGNDRIVIPTHMEMIDPRNLIKEVGVEIWSGDKPANPKAPNRPPARKQPTSQTGDSSRVYYQLKYHAPQGAGPIPLPDLPAGKVYWRQPRWMNSKGETYWAAAEPFELPAPPVHRKPINLVLRYQQGARRQLDLDLETTFKVSQDEASDTARIRNVVSFKETVVTTGAVGTQLKLSYLKPPQRDLLIAGKDPQPHPMIEAMKPFLPKLVTTMKVDKLGNILQQSLDPQALIQVMQSNPDQVKDLKDFHEIVQRGMESMSLTLPPGGAIKPLESWTAAERPVPIDTPSKFELGKLGVTFTYLGVRNRDGRDEAVIRMDGQVRGKSEGIGGKASGEILVDLTTGQTLKAATTVVLQLEAILAIPGEQQRPIRLIATMKSILQRKLS